MAQMAFLLSTVVAASLLALAFSYETECYACETSLNYLNIPSGQTAEEILAKDPCYNAAGLKELSPMPCGNATGCYKHEVVLYGVSTVCSYGICKVNYGASYKYLTRGCGDFDEGCIPSYGGNSFSELCGCKSDRCNWADSLLYSNTAFLLSALSAVCSLLLRDLL